MNTLSCRPTFIWMKRTVQERWANADEECAIITVLIRVTLTFLWEHLPRVLVQLEVILQEQRYLLKIKRRFNKYNN